MVLFHAVADDLLYINNEFNKMQTKRQMPPKLP